MVRRRLFMVCSTLGIVRPAVAPEGLEGWLHGHYARLPCLFVPGIFQPMSRLRKRKKHAAAENRNTMATMPDCRSRAHSPTVMNT